MTGRLRSKIAVVNGAGCEAGGWGNGRCTAIQLAREGATVVAVDIQGALAEETARLIREEGGKAFAIEADVTSQADMDRMAERTLAEFGRLDILAHIVGTAGRHGLFEESEQEWERVMALNVKSAFLASRACLKPMIEQRWGRVITASSIVGLRYVGKGVAMSYGASKAALAQLTRQIGLEYADHNITANTIAIGMIDSPIARRAFGEQAEKYAAMRAKGSPNGRQGTGWDTANLAAFLASEEASYINGVEIPMDAGFTSTVPNVYEG